MLFALKMPSWYRSYEAQTTKTGEVIVLFLHELGCPDKTEITLMYFTLFGGSIGDC